MRNDGRLTKIESAVISSIVIFLIVICNMVFVDAMGSRVFYKLLMVKADKEFVIPKEYQLMYDSNSNKYTIKKSGDGGCEWMQCPCVFSHDFSWMCMGPATRFSDSAKAKGALKKCISQEEHWAPK